MKLLEVSAVIEQLGIDRDSFMEWVRSLPAAQGHNISSHSWKPLQTHDDRPVTETR